MTITEKFANFAQSTLSASIGTTDTSISLASGASFPSTGPFRIVIDSEIIMIASRSSNTLTVATSGRGVEGTTPTSHAANAVVQHVLTAGGLLASNPQALPDLPSRNHTDLQAIGTDDHHAEAHNSADHLDAPYGPRYAGIRVVSMDFAMTANDGCVLADASQSASGVTVTLPAPDPSFAGERYLLIKTDNTANPVNVITNTGNINGVLGTTPFVLDRQWRTAAFITDGTNWVAWITPHAPNVSISAPHPRMNNLKVWSYLPGEAAGTFGVSSGALNLIQCPLPEPVPVSSSWMFLKSLGTNLVNCYMGWYSPAGVLLGTTADISAALMTPAVVNTVVTAAITGGPILLDPTGYGYVYAAFMQNVTTGSNTAGMAAISQTNAPDAFMNIGLTAAPYRMGKIAGAGSALPASFTPSAMTSAACPWIGGS